MTLTRRAFIVGSTCSLWATKVWAQAGDLVMLEGPAFGARWRAILPVSANADVVASKLTRIIMSVDAMMSPFKPTSEISVFNSNQTTGLQPVSADILTTVIEAKRIAQITDGAFDPTLGGVTGRYGFGPIDSAPAGRFQDIVVSKTGLQKSHPAQTLDLCGIAKGFALDKMSAALVRLGHRDFFIELGGEVFAYGLHPEGRAWTAGIERPIAEARGLQMAVRLDREALATSGDVVNSYLHAGHRYNHIIDPQSQRPTQSTLASVSVFASDAVTADALATALYAMGTQDGPEFAHDHQIPAVFLVRDKAALREVMTADFAKRRIG